VRIESSKGVAVNGIQVDDTAFNKALRNITINAQELREIETPGAAVLINGMRMRVPVDTGATKNSVQQHIAESNDDRVVDDVGPETEYAPNIELGIRDKPNYPIQPFVRPTAKLDFDEVIRAMNAAFKMFVELSWLK